MRCLIALQACWNARAFAGPLQSCTLDRCRDAAVPATWDGSVGEALFLFAASVKIDGDTLRSTLISSCGQVLVKKKKALFSLALNTNADMLSCRAA